VIERKIPSNNIQHPEKFQIPSFKLRSDYEDEDEDDEKRRRLAGWSCLA